MAKTGAKSSLPLIPLSYADEVVSPSQIQFCKDGSRAKSLEEFWGQGKRVVVLHSDFILFAGIYPWPERGVPFLYEEYSHPGR